MCDYMLKADFKALDQLFHLEFRLFPYIQAAQREYHVETLQFYVIKCGKKEFQRIKTILRLTWSRPREYKKNSVNIIISSVKIEGSGKISAW